MIKFRFYYDKDKEEMWLNQMVEQGYALRNFFFGFYFFEPCQPGEYIYQIDLFTEENKHMSQTEYLNLIKETGAEYICSWGWWKIFRRKSELGEFNLYTDADSRIEQFGRIFRLFRGVAIVETLIALYEIILTGINWYCTGSISIAFIFASCMCTLLSIVLWIASYRTKEKINKLKQELI